MTCFMFWNKLFYIYNYADDNIVSHTNDEEE